MADIPKIIIVLGPTAVGKSDLAVDLALHFNGEIISADSRQVYRGLDIGTGKVTGEEMRGISHHLLDVADLSEQYSVALWKKAADKIIANLLERNRLPIVCGGTGLFIQSIVDNISLPEVGPNNTLREKLAPLSKEELYGLLKEKDPERAGTIDRDNPRRLIRALEIIEKVGAVPSTVTKSKYNSLQIGLTLKRDDLRKRIKTRLLTRLGNGMIEEVKKLNEDGLSFERMIELGLEYKYVSLFLQKELTRAEMETKLETEIYRYAKRQETWFKRDTRIHWFSPSDQKKVVELIEGFL